MTTGSSLLATMTGRAGAVDSREQIELEPNSL
jgi:hypothetical protein